MERTPIAESNITPWCFWSVPDDDGERSCLVTVIAGDPGAYKTGAKLNAKDTDADELASALNEFMGLSDDLQLAIVVSSMFSENREGNAEIARELWLKEQPVAERRP